jgi:GPH family glycoside/pentoside/hexuronide:cation symporter
MTVLIEEGELAFAVEVPIAPAPTSAGTAKPAGTAPISRGDLRAYGVAAFGSGLLFTPMLLYVPQLYAKNYGINLAALGAALVGLRIVNAFTDQVIGFISDRTRTRWGARKPWIVVGAGLTIVAAFFLLRPPPVATLFYLIAWKLVYDLAYTITDINYTAWGAELSSDYDTRSRINGMRGFFYQIANLGNYVLPIATAFLGLTATSAYSMDTLRYFFVVAFVLIPLTTGYSLIRAPLPTERPNLIGFIRSVRSNRPLWLYLASFTLSGIGMGMAQIMFTFYDGYLRLGAWYPYLMSAFALVLLAAVPMWTWAAQRFGKHRAYALSVAISSVSMQGFWLLDPAKMSVHALVAGSLVIVSMIGSSAGALIVISPAILADVADYGRLKTGEQRTGGYYACYMLTSKIAMAIGAGIAFMLLSAFGYDAKAGAVNTGLAAFGILFTVALLPAVLKCIAAAMIWRFPLDRRTHGIIERRLAQREARNPTI